MLRNQQPQESFTTPRNKDKGKVLHGRMLVSDASGEKLSDGIGGTEESSHRARLGKIASEQRSRLQSLTLKLHSPFFHLCLLVTKSTKSIG